MERLLEKRQIEWLLHFTRAENLPNIFRYGLLPKTELLEQEIGVELNDQYRYDDCENAVCMSIEFPNYKMFYRLRKENPDVDWAVLLLDATILLDFDCAFCVTNAGSAEVYSVPLQLRKGKQALKKLFDEYPGKPSRERMGTKDWYPTNPQAEVLVFDSIPTCYIKKVYFEDSSARDEYIEYIPDNIRALVKPRPFSYRNDWEYW